MTDRIPDKELPARLVAGDKAAENELYRCYAQGIRRYCSTLLRDHGDAEDAVHNTFLSAFRAIAGLRDAASLRSWIFSIARNECLMIARRTSRQLPLEEETPDPETPLTLAVSGELRTAVREAVSMLGPIYREAIALREYEGLSYEEIAQATGVPLSTVKFRLFRAREMLAEMLKDFLGERSGI